MGFQSFYTQDTHQSIPNRFSAKETFKVFLHDDKGNVWEEEDYEGFGTFGEKNYWDLLTEMNNLSSKEVAIHLTNTPEKKYKFPNITETPIWVYRNTQPKTCEFKGFFYGRT